MAVVTALMVAGTTATGSAQNDGAYPLRFIVSEIEAAKRDNGKVYSGTLVVPVPSYVQFEARPRGTNPGRIQNTIEPRCRMLDMNESNIPGLREIVLVTLDSSCVITTTVDPAIAVRTFEAETLDAELYVTELRRYLSAQDVLLQFRFADQRNRKARMEFAKDSLIVMGIVVQKTLNAAELSGLASQLSTAGIALTRAFDPTAYIKELPGEFERILLANAPAELVSLKRVKGTVTSFFESLADRTTRVAKTVSSTLGVALASHPLLVGLLDVARTAFAPELQSWPKAVRAVADSIALSGCRGCDDPKRALQLAQQVLGSDRSAAIKDSMKAVLKQLETLAEGSAQFEPVLANLAADAAEGARLRSALEGALARLLVVAGMPGDPAAVEALKFELGSRTGEGCTIQWCQTLRARLSEIESPDVAQRTIETADSLRHQVNVLRNETIAHAKRIDANLGQVQTLIATIELPGGNGRSLRESCDSWREARFSFRSLVKQALTTEFTAPVAACRPG